MFIGPLIDLKNSSYEIEPLLSISKYENKAEISA